MYSSDEEGDAQYWTDRRGSAVFNQIARDEPDMQKLTLWTYSPKPISPDAWIGLGANIGKHSYLKELEVRMDGLDYEVDEIGTTEHLEAFCVGLAHNRSLQKLFIEELDCRRARLDTLRPLLVQNENLKNLQLHSCKLGPNDFRMLSDAFRQRKRPCSITSLAFTSDTDAPISDESVPAFLEMTTIITNLKELDLSYNNIGIGGCDELVPLLQNRDSKLKRLYLDENPIGDEGAQILANAMVHNETLKELAIGGSRSNVTRAGCDAFFRILCNTSNINATFDSNHTLRRLWRSYSSHNIVSNELHFCLMTNADGKIRAARTKIIHFHLSGNFDLSPFKSMDAVVLPFLLGYIGRELNEKMLSSSRSLAFYRIVRNFPDLCSFPSMERRRCQKFEAENGALTTDKISLLERLEKSEAENAALKRENEELKHQIEQLMVMVKDLNPIKRHKHEV